jgi:hypothetical protein
MNGLRLVAPVVERREDAAAENCHSADAEPSTAARSERPWRPAGSSGAARIARQDPPTSNETSSRFGVPRQDARPAWSGVCRMGLAPFWPFLSVGRPAGRSMDTRCAICDDFWDLYGLRTASWSYLDDFCAAQLGCTRDFRLATSATAKHVSASVTRSTGPYWSPRLPFGLMRVQP